MITECWKLPHGGNFRHLAPPTGHVRANLEQEKRIQIFRVRKTHYGSRQTGVTNETHLVTDDTGQDGNSPFKYKK